MRARHRRPVMYFAGLDAHLKYVTVAVLDRLGALVLETTVPTREPERVLAVLAPFRPLEVVVETARSGRGSTTCSSRRGSGSTSPTPSGCGRLPRPHRR